MNTDALEHNLIVAMRALSGEKGLEVTFGAGSAQISGAQASLPRLASEADLALLRGQADSLALWLAHHSPDRVLSPHSLAEEALFKSAEQMRVELLGALRLRGVAANLNRFVSHRVREPLQAEEALPEALSLLLREAVLEESPPPAAHAAVAFWREKIDRAAAPLMRELLTCLEDQKRFAQLLRRLLNRLEADRGAQRSQDTSEERSESVEPPREDTAPFSQEDDSQEMGPLEGGFGQEHEEDSGDAGYMIYGEDEDGRSGGRVLPNAFEGEFPYKIFTTRFDKTLRAEELCEIQELTRLRRQLDQQLQPLRGTVSRLANHLHQRLVSQQNRSWESDREEGDLDSTRLSRVVSTPLCPLAFKTERLTPFRETVVSLLLDNSGSMRGRPIMVAAMCADILARTLERCGARTEILGFTTRAWKGGESREAWLRSEKPPSPGRLNDLLHIIYKGAAVPWRRARRNLGLILLEGLLKENIDGEALLWAHRRLLARPEARRILMVISDGAPVDDSTLSVNSRSLLENHLHGAIHTIETRSPVELIAIGIGHDVQRYYSRAVTIINAEELGSAMIEQLAALFEEETPTIGRQRRAPRGVPPWQS